ncbi:MAG: penicillin-binding protein 2 [Azospirillaceae bacterium]
MDRDVDRQRSLTRRTLLLGGMKVALFGALGARMYQLQVLESERFGMLAEENRVNVQLIAPSRGKILDRTGRQLAINEPNFRVLLTAEQAGDVEAMLARLGGIVPLDDSVVERVMRDVSRRRAFVPVTVTENLTFDQVAEIEVNTPELPGISIDVGDLRTYPEGDVTAHVVGYVGAVSEQDLTGDPVLSLPGFQIGKSGIERHHEQVLRGQAGTRQVEVNAVGRIIRELARDDGEAGGDVRLTLDVDLQRFVQDRLTTEMSASAVVMDAYTGEIFAIASQPTYDANLFTGGIDQATWNRLLNNPYHPLTNKAIAGLFSPGSTFKMVVALAALEDGVIDDSFEAYCPGHLMVGNRRFNCWRHWGHGRLALVQAIAQSCDVFFYEVALRTGIDSISAMANRLGIGIQTGIDIPGERAGLMPTRAWKESNRGESWLQGDTVNVSIGQGFLTTTPLQLAVMTARLINGGRPIVPRLTQAAGARDLSTLPPPPADTEIDPYHIDLIRQGMIEVTSGASGTARGAQIAVEGFEMGGKSGTVQVYQITPEERASGVRSAADLPWALRDHALFVAFAPISEPRYVCSVVVEHATGGGSSVAAPIARDVLLEVQRRAPARALNLTPTDLAQATGVEG